MDIATNIHSLHTKFRYHNWLNPDNIWVNIQNCDVRFVHFDYSAFGNEKHTLRPDGLIQRQPYYDQAMSCDRQKIFRGSATYDRLAFKILSRVLMF